MKRPEIRWWAGAAVLIAAAMAGGCSDDPVDAAGTYSVSVTNRENGCQFDNWVVGDTATGIQVTITQLDAEAVANIDGVVGLLVTAGLGSSEFTGEVTGNNLDLTLFGTRSLMEGQCTFTRNARMLAELDGDILTGELVHTSNTNGSPDCGALEGCQSLQEFNGSRPPR